AVCWNVESARLARAHNDANVISIGERLVAGGGLLALLSLLLSSAPRRGGPSSPSSRSGSRPPSKAGDTRGASRRSTRDRRLVSAERGDRAMPLWLVFVVIGLLGG